MASPHFRVALLMIGMVGSSCREDVPSHEPIPQVDTTAQPRELPAHATKSARPVWQAAEATAAVAPSTSAEVHPYEQPGLAELPQLFSALDLRTAGSWRRRRSLSDAQFRERGFCREYGLLGPRLNRILRVCRAGPSALVRKKLDFCGGRVSSGEIGDYDQGLIETRNGEDLGVTELFEHGSGGWRRIDGCWVWFYGGLEWPTVKLDGRGDPIVWLTATYNAGSAVLDEVGMLFHANGRLRGLAGMSLSNWRRRFETPVGMNHEAGGNSGGCTFKRNEIVCKVVYDEVSESWPERSGLLHRYAQRWRFRVHRGSGALIRVGPDAKTQHLRFVARGPWRNVACGEERWSDLHTEDSPSPHDVTSFLAIVAQCVGRTCKVGPSSLHALPERGERYSNPEKMTIVATGANCDKNSQFGRLDDEVFGYPWHDDVQVVAEVCVQRRMLPDPYVAGWSERGLAGHPRLTGPVTYRDLYRRVIKKYKVIK